MAERMSKRNTTMQDVARKAGVSQATVSFVLNGVAGARISDQTRERVIAAAQAVGYKRSTRVRSDARLGSTIAIIMDEVDGSPFAAPFLAGAREAAWEHQSIVATVTTRAHQPIEQAAVEAMVGLPVIGVIYGSLLTRQIRPPVFEAEMPVVLLNCYDDEGRFNASLPDDVGGGRSATTALLTAGHTRIGHLAGEDWLDAGRDRLHGYRQALEEQGIAYDPDLVQNLGSSFVDAVEGTHALLDLPEPPTAVTCFNDRMAIGALETARERGLRVPHDFSIVGYDNDSFSTNLFLGGLTTIQLPHESMAHWAVQRLFQIRRKSSKPVANRLRSPLVRRGSIARRAATDRQTVSHP